MSKQQPGSSNNKFNMQMERKKSEIMFQVERETTCPPLG